MAESGGEGRDEFAWHLDPPRPHPIRFGDARMVGAPEIDQIVAFVVAALLARLDPAKSGVGDDHEDQRQGQANRSLQLARGEAEAAVPHHRHNG